MNIDTILLAIENFRTTIEKAQQKEKEKSGEVPSDMSPVVPLDPLSLELGYGLIPLVDKDKGAELLERVTSDAVKKHYQTVTRW